MDRLRKAHGRFAGTGARRTDISEKSILFPLSADEDREAVPVENRRGAVIAFPCAAATEVGKALTQLLESLPRRSTSILISASVPLAPLDPLLFFLAADRDDLYKDRFYWEHPAEDLALVGLGVTWSADSLADAARAWSARGKDALVDVTRIAEPLHRYAGPLLLGGCAFDATRPQSSLWHDFPAALLTVPECALVRLGGACLLTAALLIEREEDPLPLVQATVVRVENLFAAQEKGPSNGSPLRRFVRIDDGMPRAEWEAKAAAAATACAGDRGDEPAHVRATAADDRAAGRAAGTDDKAVQRTPDPLEKVVLARSSRAIGDVPFDPGAVLRRLRTSYPSAYTFAVTHGESLFVGATPESLIHLAEGLARVDCLAGSAPRGSTEREDVRLGRALLERPKDQAEHDAVVRGIAASLSPLLDSIDVPAWPDLMRLPNVQHLYRQIVGTARPGGQILDFVLALHPTPAVGGLPREEALAYIRRHEDLDRGWYAGPLGWLNARGDGQFIVALRSALLHAETATLFAGCGIVADSLPAVEYEETLLKMRPLLSALGGA